MCQKKRILKTQQSLQKPIFQQQQMVTKEEAISNDDEDSLCGRVNHLSASGNAWSRADMSQSFSRHPKVEHANGLLSSSDAVRLDFTTSKVFANSIYLPFFSPPEEHQLGQWAQSWLSDGGNFTTVATESVHPAVAVLAQPGGQSNHLP